MVDRDQLEAIRLERMRQREADRREREKQRAIDRANRGHPIAEFFGGLFSFAGNLLWPVASLWMFVGQLPFYFMVAMYCFVALVLLQVVKLFFK